MKSVFVWTLSLLIAIAGGGLVLAGPHQVVIAAPGDRVMPDLPVSYADLARHFVTDLAAVGADYRGATFLRVRHIDGPQAANQETEPALLHDVSRIDFVSEGQKRMVILLAFKQESVAQSLTILALYDLEGEIRLLDALDVGSDRWSGFAEPPLVELSGGVPAFSLRSSHINSSQGYLFTHLVLPQNDRFEVIASFFTLDENTCDATVAQQPRFSAVPTSAGRPDDIEATVTITTTVEEDSCDGQSPVEPSERRVSTVYRWSGKTGSYEAASDALTRLSEENFGRL